MADAAPSVSFKKRSKLGGQRRARKTSDNSSSGDEAVIEKKRRLKSNPMIQTSGAGGRSQTRRCSGSSSSEAGDAASADWSVNKHSHVAVMYESSKNEAPVGSSDQNATATLEIETEHGKDSQAAFERAQASLAQTMGKADDHIYRGLNTYGQFTKKKDTAAGNAASGFVRKGPIRAPTVMRASVRWDYAPDLCKDYKETGFCGFGDSCKFLHDRTDYKHGWEIERDWKNSQKAGAPSTDDIHKYEVSDDDDELPFKCFICRESFTDPVVTKCGHYFCEKCAVEYFQKTPKCYVCDKATNGVFNPAKELIARLGEAEFGGGAASSSKRSRKGYRKEALDSSSDEQSSDEAPLGDTPMQTLPDPAPLQPSDNEAQDSDDHVEDDGEDGEGKPMAEHDEN